ncbi:MAG: hypothetical protein ACE5GF_07275, partial [Thermodesulfobacteriota bacterium]
NVFDTHKTVRARTATKKVPNPEYEVWQKKRKGDEPPKELEEPVLEDIKRKVTHHRKTAIVAVSYRIVDSKGFVVYTGVTEKKVEAEDDSMEGIEIGEFKAPMKIARIPTDHEILNTAENEVLRKMHEELKKLFASSEKRLLREAQTLEDGRYYREALKKSVGALFILKNKGLETEKVESRIKELIREGRL